MNKLIKYLKKLTISKRKKKVMKGGALPSPPADLSVVERVAFYLNASQNARDSTLRISLILKAINVALQNDLDIDNPTFRDVIKIKFDEIANYDFNKENKTLKKEVRRLTKKLFEEQEKTQKERTKKIIEKQKSRTKNLACKNDIDFILQEKIEDIPSKDLVYIKLNTHIYCFDKDSFKGMITYSKNQKVKGACKRAIPGQPLDCKWFYPINLGFNVFINEKNYNSIFYVRSLQKTTKWILKNKKRVNFTTGLHMMSEKSGMDDVYDLVPADYKVGDKKVKKVVKRPSKARKSLEKSVSAMTEDKCLKMSLSKLKKTSAYKNIPRSAGKSKLKKKELCKLFK